MRNCGKCKNAVIYKGAHTGTCYIECSIRNAMAENASLAELREMIKHPEKKPCTFEMGTPKDGGVTYDD